MRRLSRGPAAVLAEAADTQPGRDSGAFRRALRWLHWLSPIERVLLVTACFVLFWLKAFYGVWGAAELDWVLGPVAWLVGAFGDLAFEFDPLRGYVCHEAMVVIGPSCAGINYLVIASLTGLFHAAGRGRATRAPLVFVLVLASAYLLTVIANSVRITGALMLSGLPGGLAAPLLRRAHEAQGVAVFFTFLLGYYQLLRYAFNRKAREDGDN